MHGVPPDPARQGDSSKLPGWQQLSSQEQQQLVSLMQNPAAFSQLLALQQAIISSPNSNTGDPELHSFASSLHSQPDTDQQVSWMTQFGQVPPSYVSGPAVQANSFSTLRRPLPSPPQFDRSLLHAPIPYWASARGGNRPANLLAAQVNANQRSHSGSDKPSQPLADFNRDLFRSSSLGARFVSTSMPQDLSAELSLRASSMPGSSQDIAARLHLNRAGINTATTSMIPVMSQDWLVIPFGTAQQLLPVYAGDVLAESDGDAVMLIDETGQNWPMKCKFSRAEGRFQLGDGWKPFAQRWNLGHGEQLQLSRCFVIGGCVWLDVKIVRQDMPVKDSAGKEASGKRKRDERDASHQSNVANWATQATAQQAAAPQQTVPSAHDLHEPESAGRQAEPQGAPPAKGPIISVKRLISCPTYCSRLHVNQHMAEHLLPLLPDALNVKPPLPYVYQSLFKHKVKITDENGEAWTVQYEGFVSAAQRHFRFTAGWTNLGTKRDQSDAVVLERWTEDRFKLRMHIIKDASEGAVAAVTNGRGRAKRATARTAQRAARPKSPSKRSARASPSGSPASQGYLPVAGGPAQGYSPTRVDSAQVYSPSTRSSAQGYSPARGNSSALEALHDAALMCANPTSLGVEQAAAGFAGGQLAPELARPDSDGGNVVLAAATAAADAVALNLDGSKLALAAGFTTDQGSFVDHHQRRGVFSDSILDQISDSILKAAA